MIPLRQIKGILVEKNGKYTWCSNSCHANWLENMGYNNLGNKDQKEIKELMKTSKVVYQY
jgi:hypothetical protein